MRRTATPTELRAQAAEVLEQRAGMLFHPAEGWNALRGATAGQIARHMLSLADEVEAGGRRD